MVESSSTAGSSVTPPAFRSSPFCLLPFRLLPLRPLPLRLSGYSLSGYSLSGHSLAVSSEYAEEKHSKLSKEQGNLQPLRSRTNILEVRRPDLIGACLDIGHKTSEPADSIAQKLA